MWLVVAFILKFIIKLRFPSDVSIKTILLAIVTVKINDNNSSTYETKESSNKLKYTLIKCPSGSEIYFLIKGTIHHFEAFDQKAN